MKFYKVVKVISANVKQQQTKELVRYLVNFYRKYLQNLKYNVEQTYIFHLILIGIPFILLILSFKNRWWGVGGLLKRQNLLGMAKVICQQSLKYIVHRGKSMLYLFKEAKN